MSKAKNKNLGGQIAIYIICAAVITIISIVLITIIAVRTTVTRDKIYSIISNTDYMTIKAADPNGYELTLNEMICSQFVTNNLSHDSFYKIIDESGIEDIVSDYAYSYVAFILYDSPLDEITAKKVIGLYNKNLPKIEEGLGKPLLQSDIQKTEETISSQKALFDKLSEDGIKSIFGSTLGIIRFFFSPVCIIVFSVLAAGFVVLFSFAAKNPYMPLRITGIILSAISLPSIVVLFLIVTGNFIVDAASLTAKSVILRSAGSILAPSCLKIMEIVLSLGVMMILISVIIQTIKKSADKKVEEFTD